LPWSTEVCAIFTCSWSGSTAPGAKRISAVTSPLPRSNNSVLTSQPGKRVGCHSILAGRTTCECCSDFCAFAVMASMGSSYNSIFCPDDSRTRRPGPLHFVVLDRRLEGKPRIPGEIDPGILRHFGDERVDHGPPHGLGIDGGEMRLGEDGPHHLGGPAERDQIIHDQ